MKVCERALKLFAFLHSVKTVISFIILLVVQIVCLRNIFSCLKITSAYIYNQCSFLLLLIMVCALEKTDVNESVLRKISHFHIVNLLFLSILLQIYFVGTTDMLVGLHVPTNFQMYRQNSEKALVGAVAPPPGYANGQFLPSFDKMQNHNAQKSIHASFK